MESKIARRVAPWVACTALVAAAAAFVAADDLRGLISASPQREATTAPLKPQAAYLAATVGGVPPAFDFVRSKLLASLDVWKAVAGDFNADGRDDLALLAVPYGTNAYDGGSLYVLLQQPNGTLGAPVVHTLPMLLPLPHALGLTAADLDGDGRSDLLITQREVSALFVGLAAADGGFTWGEDDWSNLVPTGAAVVADFDGDGHADVLTHRKPAGLESSSAIPRQQLLVSFGDGHGAFPRHQPTLSSEVFVQLALGQLDGDGKLDVLLARDYRDSYTPWPLVRAGNGAGGFQSPEPLLARWNEAPFSGHAVDANADGRTDVVTINSIANRSFLTVYPQLANGSLQTQPLRIPAGGFVATRAADFNGDGRVDFAHVVYPMNTTVRTAFELQDEYGYRLPATLYDYFYEPDTAKDLVTGDFNDDGLQDVVVLLSERGVVLAQSRLTPYAGAGTLPGAPVALAATAGSFSAGEPFGTATLSIGPVVDNGGTAISGYAVFSVPAGVTDDDAGQPNAVHALSGVEKHVAYKFFARAINAAGMGPPSNLSNEIVLDGVEDPEAPPTASLSFNPPIEGDFGTRPLPVFVILSKPAPIGGASFRLTAAPHTALAGVDYLATPRDFTVPAGATSLAIGDFAQVVGDFVVEEPEDFFIDVSNAVGVSFPVTRFTAIYSDDEWPDPRLSVGSATVVEGDSGSQSVSIPIGIGQALGGPMSFDLDVTPTGSTEEGVDYAPLHLAGLVLPAGQTSLSVNLTVYGDTLYEAYEGVVVTLSNPQGGKLSENFFAEIPFQDNDPLPTLSVQDVSVVEGDSGKSQAMLVVKLDAPTPFGASFALVTLPGTASEHRDFPSRYYTGMQMEPGVTELQVAIPVYGDVKDEDPETFEVALESVEGAVPGKVIATVTILNDDPPSKVNVSDVSVVEGGLAQFTVSLDKPSGRTISVDVMNGIGTAMPGADYAPAATQHLVFPEDWMSYPVNVQTVQDNLVERHESYQVQLGNLGNADLGHYQGAGWILNDDLATLSVGNASVLEGASGTTTLRFPIRLSAPMSTPVWVDVSVLAGTATVGGAGSDVQARSVQNLLIDAGRTRVDFEVAINGDASAEPDENFQVVAANVRGALVGQAAGTGTVVNDDGASLRAAGQSAWRALHKARQRPPARQGSGGALGVRARVGDALRRP